MGGDAVPQAARASFRKSIPTDRGKHTFTSTTDSMQSATSFFYAKRTPWSATLVPAARLSKAVI